MSNIKRKKNKLKIKQTKIAYLFLMPSIILFIVFTVLPFILAVVFSFAKYDGVEIKSFVGLANFKSVFADRFFLNSLKNVFVFAAWYVPLSIVTSLIIAFLISKIKWKFNVFKILFYIPSLTSGAAMIFVWKSLVNSVPGDLLGGKLAMMCVVAISLWSALGGNMLIYLAAMTGIDTAIYEAAEVDGANKFNQLIYITIPLLKPSTYFIFTTTLIGSFQLFDLVYLLGIYGNEYAITPVVEIYITAKQLHYGLGSAMSVVLFVIIMFVTALTQLFAKENNDERSIFKRKAKY